MEIVSSNHVDMEDVVLNPDPGVCRSIVRLYVYGFESLWKFMVQHLIGEAQGVRGTPVFGCVVACCRRLLYSVLIPSWYLINVIVLVALILCRSALPRSVDGSGHTELSVQELT